MRATDHARSEFSASGQNGMEEGGYLARFIGPISRVERVEEEA